MGLNLKQNSGLDFYDICNALEGFPSGQRDQTVNLTADAFEGSNPSPSKV
jgi:hypothetical protein